MRCECPKKEWAKLVLILDTAAESPNGALLLVAYFLHVCINYYQGGVAAFPVVVVQGGVRAFLL
jgi:hypothetical protein